MDEDDDAMPSDSAAKDDTNGLVAMEEETLHNEKTVPNEEEEVKPDEVIHEAAVGKGLAGALKILKERGSLNEGTNWGGRTTDKKKSRLVGIEDGPKDIRIERLDEFGRVVSIQMYPAHCTCTHWFPCIETMKFSIELHYRKP
jgi:U4/U6.U5 tri-snRNP-associated protein 1